MSKKVLIASVCFAASAILVLTTQIIRPQFHPEKQSDHVYNAKQKVSLQNKEIVQLKKNIRETKRADQQQAALLKRLDIITTHLGQNTKLTRLALLPQSTTIQGISQSESSINSYMVTLKKNALLSNIRLNKLSLQQKNSLICFRLTLETPRDD